MREEVEEILSDCVLSLDLYEARMPSSARDGGWARMGVDERLEPSRVAGSLRGPSRGCRAGQVIGRVCLLRFLFAGWVGVGDPSVLGGPLSINA